MSCFLNGIKYIVGWFLYSPPYWDDLRIPATATTVGAANPPTLKKFRDNGAASRGVYAWHFAPTIMEDLMFAAQVPHKQKQETDLYPHFHWSPTTANAGNVIWGIEYTISTINGSFPLTQLDSVTDAADGLAYKHQLAGLSTISMAGNGLSTMILGRLYRDGGNTSDTYPDDAVLHEFDFHIQIDSPGSRWEFVK